MTAPSESGTGPLRARRAPPMRRARLRSRAMLAGAAVVGAWLVLVFAGILSRADELEATARDEQSRVDALEMHAALVEDEIDFVESGAFIDQAARGLGLGPDHERRFSLPEGAPPPPTIVPLGAP